MPSTLRTPIQRPTLRAAAAEPVLTLPVMPEKHPSARSEDRDWLLALAKELQRSLELADLLESFSRVVQELVDHDALTFADRHGETRFSLGEGGEHSCRYEVVLPGDERLGSISFTRGRGPFTASETHALENVLLNLAYPLRNALRYEEVLRASARDPLTGLGNRAALDAALERELAAANRHAQPLSLIILDVDHFKRINDRHGHLVGDAVLRALASMVSGEIRDSDIALRYGGEEFVVVLARTARNGAELLAERIRKRVAREAIDVGGRSLGITVSLGTSTLEAGDDTESLLARADAALYVSKQCGRNRVTSRSRDETELAAPRQRPA